MNNAPRPPHPSPSHPITTSTSVIPPAAPHASSASPSSSTSLTGLDPNKHLSNYKNFSDLDEAMMRIAFEEAHAALGRGEVPVGVALARHGKFLVRAGNETNAACDATRHAELVALEGLDKETIKECDLWVSVEPCIMCAGALAEVHIKSVTFGCANDKFGGCGSVLGVQEKSTFPKNENHLGFACRGGLGRDEAVELLREFYARENGKTPRPRLDGTARRHAKRKRATMEESAAAAAAAAVTTTTTNHENVDDGTVTSPAKRVEFDANDNV